MDISIEHFFILTKERMLPLYYWKFNSERKCRNPKQNILIQPMSLKKLETGVNLLFGLFI